MTSKEKLLSAIQNDWISEDLCNIFYQLSQPMLSKGDLMSIVYTEDERRKVDSAYPQEYADRLRELNPNFRGEFMVYDYNDSNFGKLENVAELLVNKIKKLEK